MKKTWPLPSARFFSHLVAQRWSQFFLAVILGSSFLLLGNGQLSWFFLGLLMLFVLFHSGSFDWQRISNYPWLAILWLGFMASLLVSSIFSHSWPLSLEQLGLYATASSLFWFTVLSKKTWLDDIETLTQVFIWLGMGLAVLGLLFLIWPAYGSLLPSMNLIFASFGHSHLAAVLIMVLPISWWSATTAFFVKTKLKADFVRVGLKLIIPIFLSISLVLTFGRVALVIGTLEILAIIWLMGQKHRQLFMGNSKIFLVSILSTVFLFGLILVSTLLFSSILPVLSEQNCPLPRFTRQFCKPFLQEPRLEYWSQAWQAFRKSPISGYGPGSFQLISRRYRALPSVYAGHAHNAFIEVFAESGVITGSFFALLMLSILWAGWRTTKLLINKSRSSVSFLPIQSLVLVAVSASYLNALFDFDWSFPSIFLLTIFWGGLLLRKGEKLFPFWTGASELIKKQNLILFIKKIWYLQTGWVIVMAAGWLILETAIGFGQVRAAFTIFPYFLNQAARFDEADLNQQQAQQLRDIYRYHPGGLRQTVAKLSFPTQLENRQRDLELDPWLREQQQLFTTYLEIGDNERAYQEILASDSFIKDYETKFWFSFHPQRKQDLAQAAIELANRLIWENFSALVVATVTADSDIDSPATSASSLALQKISRLIMIAYQQNEWQLIQTEPDFESLLAAEQLDVEQLKLFLHGIEEIQGQHLSGLLKIVVRLQLRMAEAAFASGDVDTMSWSVARIIELDDSYIWETWQTISATAEQKLGEWQLSSPSGSFDPAVITDPKSDLVVIETWQAGWVQLSQFSEQLNLSHRLRLARALARAGMVITPHQPQKIVWYYQQASHVNAWIFQSELEELWFQDFLTSPISSPADLSTNSHAHLKFWQTISPTWYSTSKIYFQTLAANDPPTFFQYFSYQQLVWHQELLIRSMIQAVAERDFSYLNTLRNLYVQLPNSSYQQQMIGVKLLQDQADELVVAKNWTAAEQVLFLINDLAPGNYWAVSQLGHFYVYRDFMTGNTDHTQALAAYRRCQKNWNFPKFEQVSSHQECQENEQLLQAGTIDPYHYFYVSQLIREL